MLAVLFFFFLIFETEMFLICSNFLTETCNATKKNVRLSTIKTHNFLSFILFLSSSARRQPLWGVLQKSILQLCSNQSKNTCKGVQFFIKVAGFKSATLLKLNSGITSQVFFVDYEHRCSCILCGLAILKNTYSNIFAECLQWLLLNITSILLTESIQSFKEL